MARTRAKAVGKRHGGIESGEMRGKHECEARILTGKRLDEDSTEVGTKKRL